MDITYNIWTLVLLFEYIQNYCNNNKRLVRLIDSLTIKSAHVIIQISILIAYISNVIFRWLLYDKYILGSITKYTNFTVFLFFGFKSKHVPLFINYFCCFQLLRLIACWWLGILFWLLMSMWAVFSSKAENIGCWIGSKKIK